MTSGRRKGRDFELGQGLTEFLIVVILVAIVVLVSVRLFGQSVKCEFLESADQLDSGGSGTGCQTASGVTPDDPAPEPPPEPPVPPLPPPPPPPPPTPTPTPTPPPLKICYTNIYPNGPCAFDNGVCHGQPSHSTFSCAAECYKPSPPQAGFDTFNNFCSQTSSPTGCPSYIQPCFSYITNAPECEALGCTSLS